MERIGKLFIYAFAVMAAAYLLPGVHVDGFLAAVVVAVVLSLLNSLLKPLLLILTIPVTILTFGFFLIVINVFIVYLADYFVSGFSVRGFWWAFFFSLLLSLINSFLLGINSSDEHKNKRN